MAENPEHPEAPENSLPATDEELLEHLASSEAGADHPQPSGNGSHAPSTGEFRTSVTSRHLETGKGFNVSSLSEIFDNVLDEIKNRGEKPELPTGLNILDNKIWGLHRGELLVIGARPSEGKSSLGMQMAYNVAESGKRVVFISLEMTKEQLMERLFCSTQDVDSWELRCGKIPQDFEAKCRVFQKLIEKLPLRIFDLYGYEYSQVEQIINAIPNQIDALFLDYIQLIAPIPGMEPSASMVEYLRHMKRLSMQRQIAMVILSQLNRETVKGKMSKPELHHLKQTGALEEVADGVILCWWKTMEEDPNDVTSDYVLRIAKQRHGPVGDVTIKFLPNRFLFSDPPTGAAF